MDRVEFMLSANEGEDLRQLRKVASGGEMSRIMLAIKNVIQAADIVDTLIFDEVDAGISVRLQRSLVGS
jgi:DNA repair protein RecN (Recombination protein N)